MVLSEFQEKALNAAVRGEWRFSFDLFPHWVHRHDWTARKLYDAGFLERRGNLNDFAYEYRVKEE